MKSPATCTKESCSNNVVSSPGRLVSMAQILILLSNPFLDVFLTGIMILAAFVVIKSIYSIGPTEVGLVRKRFGRKLPGDNPIAFHDEAGYQAELLMPGLRFRFLPIYAVTKHPWVQVPAGQIGLVLAQVGEPLPIGAKLAAYT